jgi:hypothetical protein
MSNPKLMWIIAFIIGAGWSLLNFMLLLSILQISILEKPKKHLVAILLLKFPVLYLIGFLILNSRLFPVSGILAGLTSALLLVGAFKLWPKST